MKQIEQKLFDSIFFADEKTFWEVLNSKKFINSSNRNVLNQDGVNIVQAMILVRNHYSTTEKNPKKAAVLLKMMADFIQSSTKNKKDPNYLDLDQPTEKKKSALHFAVEFDDLDVMDLLIKNGANALAQDQMGDTILDNASQKADSKPLLKVLLLKKFTPSYYNPLSNFTPALEYN